MRSDPKTINALCDIRDNVLRAQQFIVGLTFDEFAASHLHVYAATRALEIISEASRRLDESLRDRHPHLPWRAIRDSGNVYRHRYDNVVETQVWAVIREQLPALIEAVDVEIRLVEDIADRQEPHDSR